MDFLKDLISTIVANIILITAIGYLLAYLLYGGYLSAFFSGGQSLPFGLADFTFIDLVAIFPEIIIVTFNFIRDFIWEILVKFVFLLIIPMVIGISIQLFTRFTFYQSVKDIMWWDIFRWVGFFIWGITFVVSFTRDDRRHMWLHMIIGTIGWIMVWITLPNLGEPVPVQPMISSQSVIILYRIGMIILISLVIPIVYIIGRSIGNKIIDNTILVRVTRLTLRRPVLDGSLPVKDREEDLPHRRPFWAARGALDAAPEKGMYEWKPKVGDELYLVAIFSKFILFYSPILAEEVGRTLMVDREALWSMECQGRKKSPEK